MTGDVVRLADVPGLHTRQVLRAARKGQWRLDSLDVALALNIAKHLDHIPAKWGPDDDLAELRQYHAEVVADLRDGYGIGNKRPQDEPDPAV